MYKNRQLMRLNKVLHKGVVKEVDCIAVGHVSFIEDIPKGNGAKGYGKWVDLDEVEFIPLTEEWLLKLRFEESLVTGFKGKIMACPVIARFNSGILYLEVGGIYLGDRIKYVHEYQNLHFSLTGQEISIKN